MTGARPSPGYVHGMIARAARAVASAHPASTALSALTAIRDAIAGHPRMSPIPDPP